MKILSKFPAPTLDFNLYPKNKAPTMTQAVVKTYINFGGMGNISLIFCYLPDRILAFIFLDERINANPISIRSKQGFVKLLYKWATELAKTEISSVSL